MEQVNTSLQDPIELLHEARRMVLKRPFYFFAISLIPAFIDYIATVSSSSFWGFPLTFLLMILGGVSYLFALIATIKGLDNTKLTDWKRALREPKDEILPLLLVVILVFFVTGVGFILILPGIYFAIVFSFAVFIHILEKKKGWKAARSSKQLTKGYWFPLFGRLLLLAGIIIIYGYLVSLVFSILGDENPWITGLSVFFLIMTLIPYTAAYQYLLYKRLKEMKAEN